jgi:hypothetical protein
MISSIGASNTTSTVSAVVSDPNLLHADEARTDQQQAELFILFSLWSSRFSIVP